ncbi:hypothetical protein PPYR_09682 [Photinus pyralis]|uniref:lysozyme n=1 Tax=Photinus pyralis TaxID=7054 RepID=A0A5N4AMY2_PHOPY|nr:hypothetical protein PPYR_09682 [Photinus pyralis]
MLKHVLLFVLFNLFYTCAHSEDVDVPVPEFCLGCICRAASDCDTSTQCEGGACGPYRITKEYWIDAGNLTYNDHSPKEHESYVKCAVNFYCSVQTIQNYMGTFKKDCNGDGKIDCDDFVAIHKLGPDNCDQELPESYAERYDYCQSLVL